MDEQDPVMGSVFRQSGEVLHVLADQAALHGGGVRQHGLVVAADQVGVLRDGEHVVALRA
jgi:hypothetical protein